MSEVLKPKSLVKQVGRWSLKLIGFSANYNNHPTTGPPLSFNLHAKDGVVILCNNQYETVVYKWDVIFMHTSTDSGRFEYEHMRHAGERSWADDLLFSGVSLSMATTSWTVYGTHSMMLALGSWFESTLAVAQQEQIPWTRRLDL